MAVSYFDCYQFLVIPFWLIGWNPYEIKVRWQKVISITYVIIHIILFIVCMIISFSQHYDTPRDVIIVTFFGCNMINTIGKHCILFFCRHYFEAVVDYFDKHLIPEEDEYQTIIKNKTKPVLKFIYPFLGITYFFVFLLDLLIIFHKYVFGVDEIIVPVFKADFFTRTFNFAVIILSSTMYNCLFISFCDYINAHIDVLIYQISHIEYERGFDINVLRNSLKRVMQRHAAILTVNELRCKAFYWVMFLQLSVSTACICFALIHLKDPRILTLFPYQFAEICIFCYFGQKVETKSDEITFAYYSMPWPEMEPSERKLILVALHISQKPLHTSGGPFKNLNHETLSNVLQSAYSYYAVLKELK